MAMEDLMLCLGESRRLATDDEPVEFEK